MPLCLRASKYAAANCLRRSDETGSIICTSPSDRPRVLIFLLISSGLPRRVMSHIPRRITISAALSMRSSSPFGEHDVPPLPLRPFDQFILEHQRGVLFRSCNSNPFEQCWQINRGFDHPEDCRYLPCVAMNNGWLDCIYIHCGCEGISLDTEYRYRSHIKSRQEASGPVGQVVCLR